MRNAFRKNDGFTLTELLVTIATGSLVMLAAVSILLLGLRTNQRSLDTASRQMTTRVLLSSLEDLATQGAITDVKSNTKDDKKTWQVFGANGMILYSYDQTTQTIYNGAAQADKPAVLEGVVASEILLDGQLLTVTVVMEDTSYSSTVYCRMNEKNEVPDTPQDEFEEMVPSGDAATMSKRNLFLKVLASQYSITGQGNVRLRNPGLILEEKDFGSGPVYVSTGQYYSEWYIGNGWMENGWNPSTPWCACYISWALNQVLGNGAPRHANVDYFMNYLKNSGNTHQWQTAGGKPTAGDLIFFDWKVNGITDPEHIGAVIKVEGDWVYTIEGNSSNRVAIRKYKYTDPRIIGYGLIDWPDEP